MKLVYVILLFFLFVGPAGAITYVPTNASNYACSLDGETYYLSGDIYASGQGIRILANNVTLYGNGYAIHYSDKISSNGIYVSGKHATIDGVNVLSQNNSSLDYYHAVNFYKANNSTIRNSYLYSKGGYAAYIKQSNNVTIYNCTGLSDGTSVLSSLYFSNSSDCYTLNSQFTGTYVYGIMQNLYSFRNIFTDSLATSTYSYGYNMRLSGDSIFHNLVVNSRLASTPVAKPHILIIGESTSDGGYSNVPKGGYGVNLSSVMGTEWNISNQANSGENTTESLMRIESELELFNPDVTLIMYGANNVMQSCPQETTINHILQMANYSASRGSKPFIMLPPAVNGYQSTIIRLNQNLSAAAAASGYGCINIYDALDSSPNNGLMDNYNATNYVDGTHPTLGANAIIAEKVADTMQHYNFVLLDGQTNHSPYVSSIMISNSSTKEWVFKVRDTLPNITYKLYSLNESSVVNTSVSTAYVILTASNLSNGQYYILQMIPNIDVIQYDPNNVSSNVEFVLSESTIATDISYILNNVTSGNTYKIYDPSTLAIYGSGSVIGSNATISVTGLPNGRYRIAETGSERVLFTYWDSSNASCNGIFQIWNSTPITNVRFVLSNVTSGTRYSVIEPLSHVTQGWGIASTNATIDVKGLQDGVYWIIGDSNSSFVNPIIIGVAFVGAAFVGASVINRWFQKHRGA